MFRVIKMGGQFTGSFVLNQVRLVIVESYFKCSGRGAYKL